ncbi:hypothetical protein AUR64_16925 [Haloprofundus marisrubri]|uniref:DUF4864 domain-containing protein n=1 Tax=Haloprofundus marisrubri TaxID=1514971 RepID=A0A0W1R8F9_9EURY|nr:DUF4864 domain-containing protein [Haloprofundus marisrubri]KTG09458.1 hypothetical protein AUR64_16925 [Haloprofundus marisrubri]
MNEQYRRHGLPRPTPERSPAEVVELQLESLERNDNPYLGSGIETTYAFASAKRRRASGSLERFTRAARSDVYRPLLDYDRAATTPVEVSGDTARQEVVVVTPDGEEVRYEFRLSRQRGGEHDGCWLTDDIVPME